MGGRIPGGHSRGLARYRDSRRPFEHRHTVCVRARCGGRSDSSLSRAESPAGVPRSGRSARADCNDSDLPFVDGRFAHHELDSLLRLAHHRTHFLHALWAPAQRAFHREAAVGCREGGSGLMLVRLGGGVALLAMLIVLTLTCTYGWGENAERLVTNKPIDTLPQEMGSFFEANRQYFVQHVTDAGELDAKIAADEHKNYIQLDHYGPFPYSALPRMYTAALAKYGRRLLDNYGLL